MISSFWLFQECMHDMLVVELIHFIFYDFGSVSMSTYDSKHRLMVEYFEEKKEKNNERYELHCAHFVASIAYLPIDRSIDFALKSHH